MEKPAAMLRDPFFRQIEQRLGGPLDLERFERRAALRAIRPWPSRFTKSNCGAAVREPEAIAPDALHGRHQTGIHVTFRLISKRRSASPLPILANRGELLAGWHDPVAVPIRQ